MGLNLQLLGIPRVSAAGTVSDLPLDKPASLLYYLTQRDDWVSRSELAFLYRPDAPEQLALSNVRVLIYRAKEHYWVQTLEVEKFRVRYQVDTDVQAFLAAVEKRAWSQALALYRGSFLEGISLQDVPGYETWLELERQDLSRKWRTAALNCAQEMEEQQDLTGAEGWLEQVLKSDPLDEDCLQVFLRVLFAAGKRAQAVDAYETFCEELERELDVEPLEATRALFESLRQSEPEAFTPRPATSKVKHNLPAQTTRFVGRKREFVKLSETLDKTDCHLLTLVGLGGVGKTRLALELASAQLETYPDGVWFVPLAGVGSPDLLVSSIAGSMGFSFSGPSDPKVQLGNFLREKDLLLLLDNFEHLVEGAVLLEDFLETAPKLKLLVTSRVALELKGEWLFDLGGLAYPSIDTQEPPDSFDAVKLFNHRAERLSTTFVLQGETLEAVAELTRKVEGLPLALELAATWTRSLSVPQLLAELDKNMDVLSSQLRDLPERHRSLRTVFDYSWQRLNKKEQEALAKLSVFQGGFTLQAAEQVADVHLALLLSLINCSLVRCSQEGRYQLHELVRQFALGRLDEPLKAELETGFSRYYLELIAQNEPHLRGPKQAEIKESLLLEMSNLRMACDLAVAGKDWPTLDKALNGLRSLFVEAGLFQEGRAFFAAMLEAIGPPNPTKEILMAKVLLQQSRVLLNIGLYREVTSNLQGILSTLRKQGVQKDLANALWWLGGTNRLMGNLAEAETYLEESLTIGRSLDDNVLNADIFFGLAALRDDQGQHAEAVALTRACLALRNDQGDALGIADTEVRLAQYLIQYKGDFLAAGEYLRRALESARQAGAHRLEGRVLNTLAALAFRQKDYPISEQLFLEALAIARQLGASHSQITNLSNLGEVLNNQERYDEAFHYLVASLDLCQRFGTPDSNVHILFVLGENARLRGDFAASRGYFRQGIEVALAATIPGHSITQGLHLLAQMYEQIGLFDQAFILATFLLAHPDTPKAVKATITSMTETLQIHLSAHEVKRFSAEAAAFTLEAMLAKQLALLENPVL